MRSMIGRDRFSQALLICTTARPFPGASGTHTNCLEVVLQGHNPEAQGSAESPLGFLDV